MAADCTTLTLKNTELAKLDPRQIFALMDVFCILDGMMNGFMAQSRFAIDGKRLNAAGEVLSELSDWLVYSKRAVSDEVERRTGKMTKADADWLGWTRIHFEASYKDDMSAFNVVVAKALLTKEEADV